MGKTMKIRYEGARVIIFWDSFLSESQWETQSRYVALGLSHRLGVYNNIRGGGRRAHEPGALPPNIVPGTCVLNGARSSPPTKRNPIKSTLFIPGGWRTPIANWRTKLIVQELFFQSSFGIDFLASSSGSSFLIVNLHTLKDDLAVHERPHLLPSAVFKTKSDRQEVSVPHTRLPFPSGWCSAPTTLQICSCCLEPTRLRNQTFLLTGKHPLRTGGPK